MTHIQYPALRKIFLQWLFVERIVLLSKAESFFKEITESIDFGADEDNEKDINVFIDFCKKSLSPIDLGLKKQLFVEADKKLEYIGIYNMKSDGISHVATKLNAEHFNCFKKFIEAAKNKSDHELSPVEIQDNLGLSRNHTQNFLNELSESAWILFNKTKGTYCIGPRTLLELGDYLKGPIEESGDDDSFNEFRECGLCSSLICCGLSISCKEVQCKSLYHQFCLNIYSSSTKKSECPKCQGGINI